MNLDIEVCMNRKQLPQGFRDEFGVFAEQKEIVAQKVLAFFKERGFERINTPLMEYKSLFNNYVMDEHQGVYEFVDTAKGNLVLRPDLTQPIARFLSTTPLSLPKKFYYYGDVIALNQEHKGAANQVTQAGIELVGYSSIKAELECLWLIADVNGQLLDNAMHIELSDVRFADTICDTLGLGDQERQELLQALFDKNLPVYETIIEQYESNALYPLLVAWPRLFGSVEEVQGELQGLILPMTAQRLVDDLVALAEAVEVMEGQHARLDLSSRPPQAYYTGVTFAGYVDTKSSYIVSGGRYDQLLANFQDQPEAAVGMAFDVDVLASVARDFTQAKDMAYIYYDQADWGLAAKALAQEPNKSVLLVDTLDQARQIARTEGKDLYIIDWKGVYKDA